MTVMLKNEFMEQLRSRLVGLPSQEVEERLGFYSEMIDDRIEDGLTEEEAVADVGSVDSIAEQIIADIPLIKIAEEKIRPKRRLAFWEILLLVLGSPIWLSLLVAALSVVLSLYVVLWSLVATLWSVFAAITACAPGGIAAGVIFMIGGSAASGIAMMGAGLVCAGIAILLFFCCMAATKGTVRLTRLIALGIKKIIVGGEKV